MDRIAYVLIDESGEAVRASFDQDEVASAAAPGQRVTREVVDPEVRVKLIRRRTDPLKLLCMEHPDMDVDEIAYAIVTLPGGVDGRDAMDVGGRITFASFDKSAAMKRMNGWTEMRPVVVNPSEVARLARGQLDPIDLLCLEQEDGTTRTPSAAPFRR